jgi:von Willebrand factor type A domain
MQQKHTKGKAMKIIRFFYLTILIICLIFPLQGCSSSPLPAEKGIVLVVDNSGSLGNNATGKLDRSVAESWLRYVKDKSERYYLNNKDLENIDMGLVQFGGVCEATTLSELGTPKSEIKTKLDAIQPYPNLTASTGILKSISRASDLLASKRYPKIILFTDMGENCTKVENQCQLVKRIEDELGANQAHLDLALVGYGVAPSLSPTSQGFPGFPGLDCIKKSPRINLRYFDAGKDNESLDKAIKDSLDFLKPETSIQQCTFVIFCNSTITITIGTGTLASIAWVFRRRIIKSLQYIISFISTNVGNGLILLGELIKRLGKR